MNVTNHRVEAFRASIIEAGIIDPVGTHHEFVAGGHGRKIDFDEIETGSKLYDEWVGVTVDHIQDENNFRGIPSIILGVANGTNRLAIDVARQFDGESVGLASKKDENDSKVLYLPDIAESIIAALKPELVLILEDVGTTGSNSVQVARHALAAGAQDVTVLHTWQRRPNLENLEHSGISYQAIIDEALTSYPDESTCKAEGFCAQGWEFIPREK